MKGALLLAVLLVTSPASPSSYLFAAADGGRNGGVWARVAQQLRLATRQQHRAPAPAPAPARAPAAAPTLSTASVQPGPADTAASLESQLPALPDVLGDYDALPEDDEEQAALPALAALEQPGYVLEAGAAPVPAAAAVKAANKPLLQDDAPTSAAAPRPQPAQPSPSKAGAPPEAQRRATQQAQQQPPTQTSWSEEALSAAATDRGLVGQTAARGALHVSPPATFEAAAEVACQQPLLQIPQSFLGISHEWTYVEEINNIPGYKRLIRLLSSFGSGPFIIRVGGGSTDKTTTVLPAAVYDALRQVADETGSRFILGLNFEMGDPALARAQQAAARALPPESIITFEIGNEPNFYEGTQGGRTALEYTRCCFRDAWGAFAQNLSCPCGSQQCCEYSQYAGPVWGHINVFPTTIKWFLDPNARWINLVTVHWYKATKEAPNTPSSLLDEAPLRREMDNLRALVQVANSYGKPLRVAEMNTISNSGRVGVSNVHAAALWTLDGCLEVAAAGAVGVNLHQGSGQNLYTAILRWYQNGVLSPTVLRPPFYGMLLFQMSVGAGSQLLAKAVLSTDADAAAHLKLWPLLDTNDGELRLVIINKHARAAGTQVVRLDRPDRYERAANVTRLVAQGDAPLAATSGITLGGMFYGPGGVPQGSDATRLLQAQPSEDDGAPEWRVYMPPGSAALLRVRRARSLGPAFAD